MQQGDNIIQVNRRHVLGLTLIFIDACFPRRRLDNTLFGLIKFSYPSKTQETFQKSLDIFGDRKKDYEKY